METLNVIQKPNPVIRKEACSTPTVCLGGGVFKTTLSCGCCFCESEYCFCDWHNEVSGYWN